MDIKIMHTGDLHVGLKFNRYPDEVKAKLMKARTEVLEKMIGLANAQACQIFVIAGDLFENPRVSKSLVSEVLQVLGGFEGECVLVLPGNHDYDDGLTELWKRFRGDMGEKIVFLNENKVYNLKNYDLEVNIYPAACNQRHSAANNISWIKEVGTFDSQAINIGIAHGALEGTSPDLEGSFYFMSRRELEDITMDLWLLGHCHVRYPDLDYVRDHKIFNSGTPEPDGMHYYREGNAWIIEIEADKTIKARSIKPGQFRFYDLEQTINSEADLDQLTKNLLDKEASHKLVRLQLTGSLDEELHKKAEYYRRWEEELTFFSCDDSGLRCKISRDIIEREFTHDSFPYTFLQKLADDPEALQIAYELIRGLK
jgi:DNA repair protein SbcD/Mre11